MREASGRAQASSQPREGCQLPATPREGHGLAGRRRGSRDTRQDGVGAKTPRLIDRCPNSPWATQAPKKSPAVCHASSGSSLSLSGCWGLAPETRVQTLWQLTLDASLMPTEWP